MAIGFQKRNGGEIELFYDREERRKTAVKYLSLLPKTAPPPLALTAAQVRPVSKP